MWYTAHIVTVFRYRNRRQRKFHVWENLVLIEADTPHEAWVKAEEFGKEEASHDDPTWRLNGIPARLEFAGVRKVVECQGPIGQSEDVPQHGAEVTYNKFNVASKADLERFVRGDPVTVEYAE